MEHKLHSNPFTGTNNRKMTLGRIRLNKRVQSIPIFEKENGEIVKFLGFKYVKH